MDKKAFGLFLVVLGVILALMGLLLVILCATEVFGADPTEATTTENVFLRYKRDVPEVELECDGPDLNDPQMAGGIGCMVGGAIISFLGTVAYCLGRSSSS